MAVRPDVPWYWRSLGVAAARALLRRGGVVWSPVRQSARCEAADAERELARLQCSARSARRPSSRSFAPKLAQSRPPAPDRPRGRRRPRETGEGARVRERGAEGGSRVLPVAHVERRRRAKATISVNRFRLQPRGRRRRIPLPDAARADRPAGRGSSRARLQFVLDVQQDGRKLVLVLPPEAERAGARLPAQLQVLPARRRHVSS